MNKVFSAWMGVLLSSTALFFILFVPSANGDEVEDIVMQSEKNKASLTNTLTKVKDKTDRYERSKEKVAQIFTGAPKKTVEPTPSPEPKKEAIALPAIKKLSAPAPIKREPMTGERTTFRLKNDQLFTAVIRERDQNGLWVETQPGVNIYLRNDEIKESYSRQD